MKFKMFLVISLIFQSTFLFAKPTEAPKQEVKPPSPSIESKSQEINSDQPNKAECYDKWHRRLSYLAAGFAVGAVATHEEEQKAKESHEVLGMATAVSVLGASYFALAAPKDSSAVETTSKKIHRYLGYALIPMMIALPMAGIDANKDYEDGKTKADGFGKNKGALTGLTVATLAASTLTLYFEF